uniref:Protein kinase domain-containing protein n=1 Tax=Caenorhabditis tropicalis TaxID=1561998 RepID=A0A1I7V1S3_9PELO
MENRFDEKCELSATNILDLEGRSINGVRIGEILGEGCFGVVYTGEKAGTSLAVKVANINSANQKRSTTNEIEMLRRLRRTTGVVQYIGVYQVNKMHFMYLELAFMNLHDLLGKNRSRRFTEATCRKIIHHGLKIIQRIHGKNIIHRDIKTDNFLVSLPKSPMNEVSLILGDFGLSKSLNGTDPRRRHDFKSAFHATPHILNGSMPTMQDDIIQFGYVALETVGMSLSELELEELNEFKKNLLKAPETAMMNQSKFFLPLFEEISRLELNTPINYDKLLKAVPLKNFHDSRLFLEKKKGVLKFP